jgi:hypothetical protein
VDYMDCEFVGGSVIAVTRCEYCAALQTFPFGLCGSVVWAEFDSVFHCRYHRSGRVGMGCNSSRAVASVPPPQPTVNPQKAPGIPTSVSSVFDHDFPGLKPVRCCVSVTLFQSLAYIVWNACMASGVRQSGGPVRHRRVAGEVSVGWPVMSRFSVPCLSSDGCFLPVIRGSFGHVYLGRDKQTGESVAVKIMDRAKIKAASIEREWTVLSHLGTHPHVVGFKSAYVTPANVCFVMELWVLCGIAVSPSCGLVLTLFGFVLGCSMRGGELFDRLIQRGAYSEGVGVLCTSDCRVHATRVQAWHHPSRFKT